MYNRRDFLKSTAWMGAVAMASGCATNTLKMFGVSGAPMQGFALKPMKQVRVACVGVGARGASALHRISMIPGTVVTAVGDGAFEGMNISEIVLPKTVKSIGKNAFKDCTYLKTIFAMGVTQIADYALYNCVWLKNIYFGKLTSIGKYAYAYVCSGHYSVSGTTFSIKSDTLKTIDEGAFQYSAVSDVDLGKADTIGKNAFLACPALVSVKIDGLSNISNEVFRNCTSLSSAEILGLSFISSDLFNGCKSLTNVHIPDATYVNDVLAKYSGEYKVLNGTIGDIEEYGIAFRKNETDLRDEVDKIIDKLYKEGKIDALLAKYFGDANGFKRD